MLCFVRARNDRYRKEKERKRTRKKERENNELGPSLPYSLNPKSVIFLDWKLLLVLIPHKNLVGMIGCEFGSRGAKNAMHFFKRDIYFTKIILPKKKFKH